MMKPTLNLPLNLRLNPLLISVAVLSTLTFSSCGKSKDTKATPEAVTTATQTTSPTKTRLESTNPSGIPHGAPTPTNLDGVIGQIEPNNQNTGAPGAVLNPNSPINSNSNDGITIIEESTSSSADSTGVADGQKTQLNESSAAGLKFDEPEAVKTGGKSGDLNYTSSANDGLMTEFRARAKTVSADQQKLNQNLAGAISSAKMRKSANGEMTVDLLIEDIHQKNQLYSLKATADGNKMKLASVSGAGNELEFQGGYLKCLDADGGCQNAYIKIKFSTAYARIIFRNTYADNHFSIYTNEQSAAPNLNFDLWKSYILNKTSGAAVVQKIDYVQVSSFEVLNGKSAMGVLVMAKDKDAVGLSVPLLAGETGTAVSAPVTKISDLGRSFDGALNSSQKLSQALSGARLVANNGLGQLRLLLSFSQNEADSKIWMDLSRVQPATLSVSDVQKFEASVPKF